MASDPRYKSQAWRDVRVIVFERDGGECQIRDAGCLGAATEVDHIISPKAGGEFYDPANLRAACQPCNSRRGGRSKAEGWRLSTTSIEILRLGQLEPLDLDSIGTGSLIDTLALTEATGSEDLASSIRRIILAALKRGELSLDRVVVVIRPGEPVPPHHIELDRAGLPVASTAEQNERWQ